jgi:hypothetical protein
MITAQPTNQVVVAGTDVSLRVGATGEEPLSFQWMLNGTNLAGATGTVLQLTNVQAGNIGNYNVIVSNHVTSVTSTIATVNLRPTILSQPSSQTVLAGGEAVFSASATGSPTLTYQWLFNGLPLAGATLNSYTNHNVYATNTGIYLVTVANAFGSTNSLPATLTVLTRISGTVREGATNGLPLSGVSVSIGTNQAVTGADGSYMANVPPGTYTVTPSLTNYRFTSLSPVSIPPVADGIDFVGFPLIRIALDTNNLAQLYGGGIPGVEYLIESSTNLVEWQVLSTNIAPVHFADPSATNLPARFYRFRR